MPGLFLFEGLTSRGPTGWLTLAWVVVLGLLATLPMGAAIGAVLRNPRAVWGLGMLALVGLVAISGIFPQYPVPGWLQSVGQIFPIYWLGHGARSALLPEAAAAAEIGGSWMHLETAAVLAAWAVAGLAVAPTLLRRMARRESGSSLSARRDKALQSL
ncbi:ABC transporter permease [Actinopolymorpha pittospori]